MKYPYGKQNITNEDINNVVEVLKSKFITQGPTTPKFEKEISNYVKSKYTLAVNSATAALHLSYLSLGINAASIVWTSPISFVATSNAALYCDAEIKFIDIDYETGNIDLNKLESSLEEANLNNQLPDLLVVVHMAGSPIDMQRIHSLKLKYDFKVVEDASHALGAEYFGYKVGSCTFSEMSVFSFHPVKMITTGEGGAITTNNKDLYEKCNLLRSHGLERDPKKMRQVPEGQWKYEQQFLGYNYRIPDINSALGISQLKRLDCVVKKRRELIKIYCDLLKDFPYGNILQEIKGTKSSYHLALLRINCISNLKEYKRIFDSLRLNGLGVQLHYYPIHLQPYYLNLGWKEGDMPSAEKYSHTTLSLPLYEELNYDDIFNIVMVLKSIF